MTSPAHTEDEFRRLVEPHRAELHAHCYRMLGSVHDAEDALQDALLRAWRGLGRFEGRSSLRSWLYRIATNTSLDLIARRPKRVLPVGPRAVVRRPRRPAAAVESVWIEAYPDEPLGVEDGSPRRRPATSGARASRSRSSPPSSTCPPTQRAVLLLRDVLGFSAREVAETLDTTVDAGPTARSPARAARSSSGCPTAASRRRCARSATTACGRSSSATSTPSTAATSRRSSRCSPRTRAGRCRRSPAGIRASTRSRRSSRPARCRLRWRHRVTHANGQPAVGCYLWDEARGDHHGWVIDVLTLDGPRIAAVTSFIGHEAFARFGLPDALP